uniref:Serine protease 30 n=1 Tax=Jaculus jaculus TaxID=51337 RepID=A0A8C5L8M7_JACJA
MGPWAQGILLVVLQLLPGAYEDVLPSVCGLPRYAGKIVGGQNAQEGQWPWQVSLWKTSEGHICGGSLIHPSWVLSAAHCFLRSRNPRLYRVKVGGLTLSPLEPQSTFVAVRRLFMHPNYLSQDRSPGDIALLQLDTPLQPSQFTPVCLPAAHALLTPGTLCWVTGWGSTQERVVTSVLQEVAVPLLDSDVCDFMYHLEEPSLAGERLIQRDMLCAGFAQGKKDSCQGDSGGPLVCPMNNSWVQVGIVSWGFGCARPYRPGVYTRVPTYVDWIQGTLARHPSGCHAGAPGSLPALLLALLILALTGTL